MTAFPAALAALMLSVSLSGCAIHMPADPHGTLDRVENGVLRVGATENPPWVDDPEGGEPGIPTGTEPALLSDFAAELGAEVSWTLGSEAALVDALEGGALDIVIGGFIDDTPWADEGAITRPYTETVTAEGTRKHVMLVRMGENRFLVALETFLDDAANS